MILAVESICPFNKIANTSHNTGSLNNLGIHELQNMTFKGKELCITGYFSKWWNAAIISASRQEYVRHILTQHW
jgi:hypothetical protein